MLHSQRSLSSAKPLTPCWIPVNLDVGVASWGRLIHLQGAALVCITIIQFEYSGRAVWIVFKSYFPPCPCMSFCLEFLALYLSYFHFFSNFERDFPTLLPNAGLGNSVMRTLFREGCVKYFIWKIMTKK